SPRSTIQIGVATGVPFLRNVVIRRYFSSVRLMTGEHTLVMEPVREAGVNDFPIVGRLLHAFNTEFGEPTPPPAEMADRIAELVSDCDTLVLLIGEPAVGLSVMRFRKGIWSRA